MDVLPEGCPDCMVTIYGGSEDMNKSLPDIKGPFPKEFGDDPSIREVVEHLIDYVNVLAADHQHLLMRVDALTNRVDEVSAQAGKGLLVWQLR